MPTLTEMLAPVIDRTANLVKHLGANPPGAVWLADPKGKQHWDRIRTLLLSRKQVQFLQVFKVTLMTDDTKGTTALGISLLDEDDVEAGSIAVMLAQPDIQAVIDQAAEMDNER